MTKDPICGMTVDETTALRAERDGQTFFFCGESCRKKFLGAPATPSRRGEGEEDSKASITHTSAKARDPHCGGVLYPFFGWLLSPILAGAAMSLSSVSVIGNALRLRKTKL